MRNIIQKIAEETRKEVEELFKLEKRTNRVSNLNGWCAIASGMLWQNLKRNNIDSTLNIWLNPGKYSNHPGAHVFSIVPSEDLLIDLTATQFKELQYTKIYMEHEKIATGRYFFYTPSEICQTQKELKQAQSRAGWNRQEWTRT